MSNTLPLFDYAVSKHNKLCYLSVQSSSASTMFFTLNSAATAASLLGLNADTSGFRTLLPRSNSVGLSHDSSRGYKCCTGRSKQLFPALSLAPLMIPSFPLMNYCTTPNFHWFRFFSSPRIITTSPTLRLQGFEPSVLYPQCRSLSPRMYSFVQRNHIASLHLAKYFALFLKL